jgi:hypothetical protein
MIMYGSSAGTNAMQKMKPEELIAKHLASIGTPEAIAAVHNRTVKGTATVVFRPGPENKTTGTGVFISEDKKVRLSLLFPALNYPGEEFAFDGNKVSLGYVRPGVRSLFSEFIMANDFLVKEGLLGGTLSTAWALYDVAGRKPRLEYNGIKKRVGKDCHELRYMGRKGGGDARVLMYFDAQTFRHVETEYRVIIIGQTEKRYTLTEAFDNFEAVDGLTLPRTYKLNLTIDETATSMIDWSVTFDQIQQNQQLDAKTFVIIS